MEAVDNLPSYSLAWRPDRGLDYPCDPITKERLPMSVDTRARNESRGKSLTGMPPARGTHTALHKSRVAGIVTNYLGARTLGFPTVAADLWARLGYEGSAPVSAFVPDAFRFNEATSEIELYEVEVTHPLSDHKMAVLGNYWAEWDAEDGDWLPVVIRVDRFGNHHRMDLGIAYFEMSIARLSTCDGGGE
jgi:hypothetical protein